MRRGLLAAGFAALLVVFLAGPASAHVTVSSSSNEPGARATLTFTVPTESPAARTTGLTVHLPPGFTFVRTEAVAGWTTRVTATEVTWTASGTGIAPGRAGTFRLGVGPLPTGGTVFFPATQHYSDGTDVNWVQQTQGDAETDHPAPGLALRGSAAAVVAHAGHAEVATSGAGGLSLGVGMVMLLLALVAGGAGAVALSRTRA